MTTKKEIIEKALEGINIADLNEAKKYKITVKLHSGILITSEGYLSKNIKDRFEYLRKLIRTPVPRRRGEEQEHDFSAKNIKSVTVKIS